MRVQVPHQQIRFLVPPLVGLTTIRVQIIVGGQSSNTFIVPVDPPVIDTLTIFDVTVLVRGLQ